MGSVHAPPRIKYIWLPVSLQIKSLLNTPLSTASMVIHHLAPASSPAISFCPLKPHQPPSWSEIGWHPHTHFLSAWKTCSISKVTSSRRPPRQPRHWSSAAGIVTGTHLSPPRDPWEQRLCVPKCLEQRVPQRGHMGLFVEWTNEPMNRNKGTAVHSKQVLAHRSHAKSWRITHQSLTWGSSASPSPPRTWGWLCPGYPGSHSPDASPPSSGPFSHFSAPISLLLFLPSRLPLLPASPKGSESWVTMPGPHAEWINWITPGKINLLPVGLISSQTEGPLSPPGDALQRPPCDSWPLRSQAPMKEHFAADWQVLGRTAPWVTPC